MTALVIGGSGLIGAAVVSSLRSDGHEVMAPSHREFDLLQPPNMQPYRGIKIAVLCAGIKGLQPCEGNVESWRVNVDGAVSVGRALMWQGSQLVYVSSDAVEWSNSSYARQKALVEMCLLAAGNPVIVRPSRVSEDRAPELARMIVGIMHQPGIHHWS